MTQFVGNSACTDDQRADTLTYHLAILTQSVSFALVHLEALLQEPGSPDRDGRLGAILYVGCGSSRASAPRRTRCWPRSMAGSRRGLTRRTSRTPKPW
jgi:hypothetical protein